MDGQEWIEKLSRGTLGHLVFSVHSPQFGCYWIRSQCPDVQMFGLIAACQAEAHAD